MHIHRVIHYFSAIILMMALFPVSAFSVDERLQHTTPDASSELSSITDQEIALSSPLSLPAVATGPLRVSSVNGRYFADGSGRIVFLTGSHTWCNQMDCDDTNPIAATFNYPAFLDFLVAKNHNFFRLWRSETARGGEAGPNFWFSPMPYARSGQCCAFDGGNKFDLSQFNQAYFDRMRERVVQAGERGIYVSIMLFDGWSVESKISGHNPWEGHPYKLTNNINNINGDTNNNNQGSETHTLTNAQVTALQEAYVRKVIDTLNDLDNVLYEISNESPSNSEAWQYHMIQLIKNYEASKPKRHPVGMTWEWPGGNNQDLYASPADWISLGGGVDLNTYQPPVASGNKVILADTDHLCGICGNRHWVWKSFTRGENPIFMDIYDNATSGRGMPFNNPNEGEIRNNLGYVRSYALRMNLAAMIPTSNTGLCSTGYCLRNAAPSGEYLAYLPSGGSITLNLSATPENLLVEWFNPANGTTVQSGIVPGGANQQFTAPFGGDAVLYLKATIAALSRDTAGVFRPSNGALYLKNTHSTGFADVQINYGIGGDYPVVGDWDGDGDVTIGIYRNGSFYLRNSNTIGFADVVFPFGTPGDQPVAGDWDGDDDDTIGVYRSSTGSFYLRNSNSSGSANMIFALGILGDVGIAGDWNGDGLDTTGVFRPSNGALYLKNMNSTGFADIQINYGVPGDKPITGDWNDDGVDTIGIYRNGTFYLRNSNTIGFADLVFGLGIQGDHPIAGDWDNLP